jgi:hypothetical protein
MLLLAVPSAYGSGGNYRNNPSISVHTATVKVQEELAPPGMDNCNSGFSAV